MTLEEEILVQTDSKVILNMNLDEMKKAGIITDYTFILNKSGNIKGIKIVPIKIPKRLKRDSFSLVLNASGGTITPHDYSTEIPLIVNNLDYPFL